MNFCAERIAPSPAQEGGRLNSDKSYTDKGGSKRD